MITSLLTVILIISWWGYYNLYRTYSNLFDKSIRLEKSIFKLKNELALYRASDYYIEEVSKNG